ncbi:MAG TPA: DNA topoisomerase I, partial [Methanomassiliicoccales archaeon]|nr:DNA topoisomerase I [Methanomassiliicoccales archaeon]
MRKLVISEKGNAAARIAYILSRGESGSTRLNGVQVFTFSLGDDEFNVVGLRGHILELDYPAELNNWEKVGARELVYATPEKRVTARNIIMTLKELSDGADEVIIATDFDREGELIGLETVELLDLKNAVIKRSRFSALTRGEIDQAFSNLTEPDEKLAEAAECRQIIDLAWGASLTRFISLSSGQVGSNFLSVGRVQSPTLSLIVDRHEEISSFVPKPYWNISARIKKEAEFSAAHDANPFWNEDEAKTVMEDCSAAKGGEVRDYSESVRDEYPPAPFNTTILLAEAVRLGMTASAAMKIAEDLYTAGYISYPRTDNTVYPRSLNLRSVLEKLRESEFKAEAEELLAQEQIRPSRGKVEATDHPPIYPTEAATKKELKGDRWRLYELVARRFMATVAPSCKAEVREAVVGVAQQPFRAKGYRIVSPGWRKFYPYIRPSEIDLPHLEVGEMVEVLKVEMDRLETQPPRRYTQGTLIQEMERLGLGTKSTRHEIVQKLYDRKYVSGADLVPTLTGIAVADALKRHARTITESKMTSHLEGDMEEIAEGRSFLAEVVRESQDMLSDVLDEMEANRERIGGEIRDALHAQSYIGICPDCKGTLRVKRSRKGEFIACSNYPDCKRAYPKPKGAKVESTDRYCGTCGAPLVRVIRRGMPPADQCLNPECESNRRAQSMGVCPQCGAELRLIYSRAGKRFVGCSAYPDCKRTYPLPQFGTITYTGEKCEACGSPIMMTSHRGRPWRFCVNMECPKKAKKAAAKPKSGVRAKKAKAPAKRKT